MNLNRRTLVRTAAWTAPAVTVGATAPAFASSRSGVLDWTFTVKPAPLAGGRAGQCEDLEITFDNTRSGMQLVPTKVFSEAYVFGNWQGQEQANSQPIPAGQSHTMKIGQAVPAGWRLRFTVTFNDARGVSVTAQTGEVVTGTCGASATFVHRSGA